MVTALVVVLRKKIKKLKCLRLSFLTNKQIQIKRICYILHPLFPILDYYMPETMSPKAKKALEQWHKEQRDKNVVFDFQKELVDYCESDVRLLKEGCLTLQ